MQAWKE
jgi:hypothetical protein